MTGVLGVGERPRGSCEQTEKVSDLYYRTFHPGMYLSRTGSDAVVNKRTEAITQWPSSDEIESTLYEWIPVCEGHVQTTDRQYWNAIKKKINKEPYFCRMEGLEVSIGNKPQEKIAFQKASDYCFEELVEKPVFWSLPSDEMISEIKKVHKMLFSKKDSQDESVPGNFRKEQLIILDDMHSFEQMLEKGLSKLSSKEKRVMKEILKSPQRFDALSPEDLAVIRKIVPVGEPWQKLDNLMTEFVLDLKKMKEEGSDSVDLAAFFHQKIVKIHPFADGNGRLARMFMNVILRLDGYSPVSFENAAIYTRYTAGEVDSFASYLSGKVSRDCKA